MKNNNHVIPKKKNTRFKKQKQKIQNDQKS